MKALGVGIVALLVLLDLGRGAVQRYGEGGAGAAGLYLAVMVLLLLGVYAVYDCVLDDIAERVAAKMPRVRLMENRVSRN